MSETIWLEPASERTVFLQIKNTSDKDMSGLQGKIADAVKAKGYQVVTSPDIRDVLLEDVAQRNIPLSHKKLRRALKAITRSESYLCAMKAGACRYDTEGYVTEHISQEEEAYAAARLDKIRRQNRIKAELQAVLDEK
ncbi:fertility inhibition protein FinO [Escherichia coli]|nr:fertility inhibition protein FinO [Escherichia coli]